jgi:membrane associated rhomboid family serine protease
LNPNYEPPAWSRKQSSTTRPVTLGDLENNDDFAVKQSRSYPYYSFPQSTSASSTSALQSIVEYAKRIHQISPTLSVVSAVCILVHILWQIPSCQTLLDRHFVASRQNIRARPHSLLLSAVSHAAPMHLVINLMAYLSFGPALKQFFERNSQWPLWPLVLGAAIAGSGLFVLKGEHFGCMGLSGVTLAFLALTAKLFPHQQLGIVVAVFPVRVPAQHALTILLVVSAIGSFNQSKSRVAHLAHFGGLLFGIAYYELWLRRKQVHKLIRQLQRAIPFTSSESPNYK